MASYLESYATKFYWISPTPSNTLSFIYCSASTPLELAIPSQTGHTQHRDRASGCGRVQSRGTLHSRSRKHVLARGHGQCKVRGRVSASPSAAVGAQANLGGLDSLGGRWDKVETVQDRFMYKLSPGPTSADTFLRSTLSALDLFSCCFTNEVWELFVAETNRFAANYAQIPGTHCWYEVTVTETKAFIGILLTMGI